MAFDPLYGNYGYQVDPDLLRRAQQGPGFGAALESGLKSLAPQPAPVYSAAYGVGATPAAAALPAHLPSPDTVADDFWAKPAQSSVLGDWWRNSDIYKSYGKYNLPTPPGPDMTERVRGQSVTSPSPARLPPSVAPDMPERLRGGGASLPAAPTSPPSGDRRSGALQGTPAQGRTAGAALPSPDFIAANPGYQAQIQQFQQQRLLGEQGYSDIEPGSGIMRKLSADAGGTEYRLPGVTGLGGAGPGKAVFRGAPGQSGANVFGLPPNPGGGFLGYAGTPETAGMTQQQATAYNVANLNRQIEALRSLNEARQGVSAAGGSAQNLPSPPSFDPFARAGDGFGDSGMRAAQYDSMMKRAADTSIPWRRRQGLAEAAQGMLAPGLAIVQQQGALAQLQAKPSGDPYQLARLTLDQQRLGLDQQNRLYQHQLDQQRFATAQQNQRDRLQYQQQRDGARDRLAMERQQQQQKPQSLDQIKAGMMDRLFTASLASQDTRLNPEERAKWQAELDRMGPFYQQYLGGGGGGF